MSLQDDLQTAVAKVTADSGLLHRIVHGDASTTVVTEGGPVKSVAKAIADVAESFHREAGDLVGAVADARQAKDEAAEFAATAGTLADEANAAVGRANAAALAAESGIGDLVARAEVETQATIAAAAAAASDAQDAAAEARAHSARFALPIEEVARRALTAQARQVAGTRDTLSLFSAFADDAGRSEASARASADEAARQAEVATGQVAAAVQAAEDARGHAGEAAALVDAAGERLHVLTETAAHTATTAIQTIADDAESGITDLVARSADAVMMQVATAGAAAADAEEAAAEARAHAARFALPIEAVARRALAAQSRQLAGTRDTLTLFSAFADEAGRSEAAAKASADEAARQARLAAEQLVAAAQAVDDARARVTEVGGLVEEAQTSFRDLSAAMDVAVLSAKADITAAGTAAEDHIGTVSAAFETEVQGLVSAATGQINSASAHVARFAVPIEQVARAALDAERRRLLGARDDLLRFVTVIES